MNKYISYQIVHSKNTKPTDRTASHVSVSALVWLSSVGVRCFVPLFFYKQIVNTHTHTHTYTTKVEVQGCLTSALLGYQSKTVREETKNYQVRGISCVYQGMSFVFVCVCKYVCVCMFVCVWLCCQCESATLNDARWPHLLFVWKSACLSSTPSTKNDAEECHWTAFFHSLSALTHILEDHQSERIRWEERESWAYGRETSSSLGQVAFRVPAGPWAVAWYNQRQRKSCMHTFLLADGKTRSVH